MTSGVPVYGSGAVADRVQLPRWRLLYLVERGVLPGPSLQAAGRRLFTDDDVRRIEAVLSAKPELRTTSFGDN